MENVKCTIKNNKLTIEVDLSIEGKPSTSGKSLVLASTHGNVKLENSDVTVGLNVYKSLKGKK
jgi:hypothetical protein